MTEKEWVAIWEDATSLVANAPPASAGSAWFVRLESYDAVPVALAFNALITTSGVFMPAIESVITEIERIYAYGRGVPTGLETWEKIISDLRIFSYYKLQPSYPVEVDRALRQVGGVQAVIDATNESAATLASVRKRYLEAYEAIIAEERKNQAIRRSEPVVRNVLGEEAVGRFIQSKVLKQLGGAK